MSGQLRSRCNPGPTTELGISGRASAAILGGWRAEEEADPTRSATACRRHDNLSARAPLRSRRSFRVAATHCSPSRGGVIIGAEAHETAAPFGLAADVAAPPRDRRLQRGPRAAGIAGAGRGRAARAAGMVRTIQIAVESALAVRGRPQAELVDLLNDLRLDRRRSTASPLRPRWTGARRLEYPGRRPSCGKRGRGGAGHRDGNGGARRDARQGRPLVGVRPARPVRDVQEPRVLGGDPAGPRDRLRRS